MSDARYPGPIRVTHWIVGPLVLGMLALGLFMTNLDDGDFKWSFYPWHKSFGLLTLLCALVFVAARIRNRQAVPAPLGTLADWERRLATLTKSVIYVCVLLMPASGYVMSATFPKGSGVAFFGVQLPDILDKSEAVSHLAHEVHEYTAWALCTAVILHIAGVIKHRFIDPPERDVLGRML